MDVAAAINAVFMAGDDDAPLDSSSSEDGLSSSEESELDAGDGDFTVSDGETNTDIESDGDTDVSLSGGSGAARGRAPVRGRGRGRGRGHGRGALRRGRGVRSRGGRGRAARSAPEAENDCVKSWGDDDVTAYGAMPPFEPHREPGFHPPEGFAPKREVDFFLLIFLLPSWSAALLLSPMHTPKTTLPGNPHTP